MAVAIYAIVVFFTLTFTLTFFAYAHSFSAAPFFCRHPSVHNTILSYHPFLLLILFIFLFIYFDVAGFFVSSILI